ncbi:hypothetical protein MKW98_019036 [Papaver atlanticum]|uniref:J domain-containing protein n=1 Tax=Papaver atlanticum TaxID=357466 RepID=A0AAD4TJD6_9MAGN|nr:hypothetical protein MKW98_019036 [Papaver atlanticum]
MEIDHYAVLGLPSGEEEAKLTKADIKKAYKTKARELHPDKCPDDPNANTNFQRLQSSCDILRDEIQPQADLDEREPASFPPDAYTLARQKEERDRQKMREEIAKVINMTLSCKRYLFPPDPDNQVREEDVKRYAETTENLFFIWKYITIGMAGLIKLYKVVRPSSSEKGSDTMKEPSEEERKIHS